MYVNVCQLCVGGLIYFKLEQRNSAKLLILEGFLYFFLLNSYLTAPTNYVQNIISKHSI